MRTVYISALIAAACICDVAMAQSHAFEGPHAGTELIYQRGSATVDIPGSGNTKDTDSGRSYRGFVGFDFPVSENFVVGGELGLSNGGADIRHSVDSGASLEVDQGMAYDISARAGYVFADSMLVYGRAGYINTSFDTVTVSAADVRSSNDEREGALLLGAGAEWAVSDSFSIRGEYRRANFDSADTQQILVGGVLRF